MPWYHQCPLNICLSDKIAKCSILPFTASSLHLVLEVKAECFPVASPHFQFVLKFFFFSPILLRYLGYGFFLLKYLQESPKEKRKEALYSNVIVISTSTKSVRQSQKYKHPLKHIYFNKDISRTTCLSLLKCAF